MHAARWSIALFVEHQIMLNSIDSRSCDEYRVEQDDNDDNVDDSGRDCAYNGNLCDDHEDSNEDDDHHKDDRHNEARNHLPLTSKLR